MAEIKKAPKFVYNCVRCGQYCSKVNGVPVSLEDIMGWRKNGTLTGIAKNIGVDMAGGIPKLILETEAEKEGCPLYDHENKNCQVYHDMPLSCQAYPLGYNGEKYFVTDKACSGLGHGEMSLEQLKTQKEAACREYESNKESNAVIPLIYSIIMGELLEQSRKSMENMTEEQKNQLQDMIKGDEK